MVEGELSSVVWKSEKLLEFVQEEGAVEEWLAILSGEGRFKPPPFILEEAEEQEFCLERERGLLKGEGEDGVEGVDEARWSSFLAWIITDWSKDSGPKAKRIISFSPWSWIRRNPMIFEAFWGSRFWILWKTIFVASYASMSEFGGGFGGSKIPLHSSNLLTNPFLYYH